MVLGCEHLQCVSWCITHQGPNRMNNFGCILRTYFYHFVSLTFLTVILWNQSFGNIITVASDELYSLKSPATRLLVQRFAEANIKESINVCIVDLLRGKPTTDQWNPTQRASNAESISLYDIIMQYSSPIYICAMEKETCNRWVLL